MKISIICIIIFLQFSLSGYYGNSMQRTLREDEDEKFRLLDSLSVKELLVLWRLDSTTCQNKRSGMMAHYILDSIPIINKDLDYVISILGQPYSVTKQKNLDPDLKNDKDFVIALYYVDVFCKDGKPIYESKLNECFLTIKFSSDSLKVKSYGITCK